MTSKKPSAHPIQAMYSLLTTLGVVRKDGDIHIKYEPVEDVHLSVAIPSIKFGIALDKDKFQPLVDQGWHIEKVVYSDLEPFARIFHAVDAARLADIRARVDPNVKTTSQPEEILYAEISRRVLPMPDRNYKFLRDNGTELTTPDFTWEEQKIAFFMDGSYWHSVKDDKAIIKELKSARGKKLSDDIVAKRKDKVRKDGAIRSELGARGWIVLSCTDDDLTTPEGVDEVMGMIEQALKTASLASKVTAVDEDTDSLMDHLLSPEPENDDKILDQV